MLRDRLVCGVNDDSIQRRLLTEDGLTFETALKKAQAILFCSQQRRSHFFSPRPHPYLPCFAPLSRIERLSLHCSPN